MGLKAIHAGNKPVFVSSPVRLGYPCPVCGMELVQDRKRDVMWCEGSTMGYPPYCSQVGIMFKIPCVELALVRAIDFPPTG